MEDSGEKNELRPVRSNPTESLDTIAQRCVQVCGNQLWEMGCKLPNRGNDSISPTVLRSYLTGAFCDHLIVTFAYRFYCENLEAAPRNRYLESVNSGEVSVDSSNFHKKFREFYDDLGKIVEAYKEWLKSDHDRVQKELQKQCQDVLDKPTEPSDPINRKRWKEFMASAEESRAARKERLTKQGQSLKRMLDSLDSDCFKGKLSAPDWIFYFAMTANWKKSPFTVRDGEFAFVRDGYNQLVHYFSINRPFLTTSRF